MAAKIDPIPTGFHSVTPCLTVKDSKSAIEFYKSAFDARERCLFQPSEGEDVVHAEMMIGDSIIMLADETSDFDFKSPETVSTNTVHFVLYVPDVDTAFGQAVDAGATIIARPKDEFYGERCAQLKDPFGHHWSLMSHIEDLDEKELQRRTDEIYGSKAQTEAG